MMMDRFHDYPPPWAEPPFWEKERGGGPRTDWQRTHDEALDRAQDRKLRLLDPSGLRGTAAEARRKVSHRSYRERRGLGLCTVCEARTTYARCDSCRQAYNLRPSRQWRRKL